MIAHQTSIHRVSKQKPAYLVLGFPVSLPINCIYSTPRTAIYATKLLSFQNETETTGNASVDARIYGFRTEKERQKTYNDRSRYEPSYRSGEELLVFNQTFKKDKQENLLFSSYSIVEITIDLNLNAEGKKTREAINVHYDLLKKYKTR